MTRPKLLLFDVNETLLDLGGLRPDFERIFGSTQPMGEWFARLLHGSLLANHLGRYRPFDLLAIDALITLARRRQIDLEVEEAASVVAGMRTLSAYPEVPAALTELAAAGFRMAALTNNPPEVLEAQLANAGIADAFERQLTVEGVHRFKPAPEVYLHATAVMQVEVDEAMLIAAHDWDVVGAMSVGLAGAFLARPGAIWGLPYPPPELVAPDLATLAAVLSAH